MIGLEVAEGTTNLITDKADKENSQRSTDYIIRESSVSITTAVHSLSDYTIN